MEYKTAFLGILLVSLLAYAVQVLFYSPISPVPTHRPPASLDLRLPPNNKLQEVIKLGEGYLKGPEDTCVDKEGILYTATRDGWIKRMHRNGTWEDWKMVGGDGLLGLTFTRDGDLIVCDAHRGLLKVGEDGVTVLASHVNGSKIRLADDVKEASDGSLYFSDASNKFGLHEWYLDVLEAQPHGQLLKYDPSSKETSILLRDLAFPNGVALSEDEDYLVVCETWKYRCLKYWLNGENKGQTEIFVDHLPGGPDNIKLAPDGAFWIALLELSPPRLLLGHTWSVTKHFLATFPSLMQPIMGKLKMAMVVKVGTDGKILEIFGDRTGKVMPFVTSALEFENHLYLGNLGTNFIGKLPLESA